MRHPSIASVHFRERRGRPLAGTPTQRSLMRYRRAAWWAALLFGLPVVTPRAALLAPAPVRHVRELLGQWPCGASQCRNRLAFRLLHLIHRGDTVVDRVAVFMIGLPGAGKVRANASPHTPFFFAVLKPSLSPLTLSVSSLFTESSDRVSVRARSELARLGERDARPRSRQGDDPAPRLRRHRPRSPIPGARERGVQVG